MKLLVDSGECATLEEAIATFAGYGVRLILSDDVASSPAQQIIALTVINTAARSFQGNVHIGAAHDLVLGDVFADAAEEWDLGTGAQTSSGCRLSDRVAGQAQTATGHERA